MCLDVELDGRHWMMDPGFGLSLTGPIPREDGARREEFFGLLSLHRRVTDEGIEQWELRRGEAVQHLTDLLPVIDRKSTRLNSSHVAISYAVFCLKKKKNKRVQLRFT